MEDPSTKWASFVAASMYLVHKRFEAQAARNPDKIAVIAGDEYVSYAELNERANRLARMLLKVGVSGTRKCV